MEYDIKTMLGIAAIVLTFGAYIPYVNDIVRGRTQPHMYTWLIWFVTTSIAVGGIWKGGGEWGAIAFTAGLFCVALVVLLSFKYGTKNITLIDSAALLAALIALFVWWGLSNPLLAIVVATGIDLVGYVPTFRKSFVDPWSETVSAWYLFFASSAMAILALSEFNAMTLTYLGSITVANLGVAVLCTARRMRIPPRHMV